MRFRNTAGYALVLILIVGVYAVMDMQKDKADRKQKEARRVFTFSTNTVSQIEIEAGENQVVSLKKTGKWTISSPIVSEADNTQLTGLLSTLQNVEVERKIGKPSGNLQAFGLDKPSFVVRFLAGAKWLELDAGAQNPSQTDRYAMAGKNGEVFLISSQAYDDLNKSLTDLRGKELFSWGPGQVKALQIKWRDGARLDIEREGDTSLWKSKSQPELKIAADKVDSLLEGLHWLRATDFLAKGAMPPSPDVDVKLQLKDGSTPELKVALPAPGKKQAVATSSEVQCPVLLSTYFLSSIPHTADSLVDRSLVSTNTSHIKKLAWKTDDSSGDLVRIDSDKWGKADTASAPKALENSWLVENLLAYAHSAAYTGAARPAGKPPQSARNSLRLVDVFGKMSSLTWNAPAPGTTGPVDAWLEKDGSVLRVRVKREDLQRIGGSLARINPAQSAAPQKSGASANNH